MLMPPQDNPTDTTHKSQERYRTESPILGDETSVLQESFITQDVWEDSSVGPATLYHRSDRNPYEKWVQQARLLGYETKEELQAFVARREEAQRQEDLDRRREAQEQRQYNLELARLRGTKQPPPKEDGPQSGPIQLNFRKWGGNANESFESFIGRLERYGEECGWNKKTFFFQLLDALPAEALEVYGQIDRQTKVDYDSLKKELEARYALTEEDLGKRFYHVRLKRDEAPSQFRGRTREYLLEWYARTGRPKTFEEVIDFFTRVQMEVSWPHDLKALLKLNEVRQTDAIVQWANKWFNAHGHPLRRSQNKNPRPSAPSAQSTPAPSLPPATPSSSSSTPPPDVQKKFDTGKRRWYRCRGCKTDDHHYKRCPNKATAAAGVKAATDNKPGAAKQEQAPQPSL